MAPQPVGGGLTRCGTGEGVARGAQGTDEDVGATVFLKDMTTHGARVEGLGRMQIDESITLNLPGLKPKTAFVAWCDAHSAGLEFEKPLCSEVFRELVILHARREGTPPTAPMRHAA